MKRYTVKIFALDGTTLVRNLNSNEIMSGYSWTEQINGGQGEFVLKVKLPFSNTDLAYNQIIRVYCSDDVFSPQPRLIYSGVITILKRVSDMNGQYIEMRAIGLCAMLKWTMAANPAGTYVFNRNQAPDLTARELIDHFVIHYPGPASYTHLTLPTICSVLISMYQESQTKKTTHS